MEEAVILPYYFRRVDTHLKHCRMGYWIGLGSCGYSQRGVNVPSLSQPGAKNESHAPTSIVHHNVRITPGRS